MVNISHKKTTDETPPEAAALIAAGQGLLTEFRGLAQDSPNKDSVKASLAAISNSLSKFLNVNNPAIAKTAAELIGAIQQAVGASAADLKDLTNLISEITNRLKNASPEELKAIQNQLSRLAANPRFQATECLDIIQDAQLRVLRIIEEAPAKITTSQNLAGGFVQATLAQAGLSFLAAGTTSAHEIVEGKNIS